MSRFVSFIFVATLLIALAPAAAQEPEEIQDATTAAAEAHSVVLENEHVRVISAIASAGHKSPMHSHPPLLAISLGTARGKLTNADGSEVITNLRPGTMWWVDGGAHKWELLAGEIDVIGVEVKAARDASETAEAAGAWPPVTGEIQDATVAAPGAHAVEFENEHVRVISAIASAGHKSPMHSHPPLVVISMNTARIKVTNADGSEAIINFRPGTVFWVDGAAHEWELLAGEVNAIGVEVKAAAKGPMAGEPAKGGN